MQTERSRENREGWLGRGLGLASLGLGLVEVAAPGRLARWIGVEDDRLARNALRAAGVRELAAGAGLLARPRHPSAAWSRTIGDLLDLAMLGWMLGTRVRHPRRLALVAGAVVGVAALDTLAARRLTRDEASARVAITIRGPAQQIEEVARKLPVDEVTLRPAPGGRGTEICVSVSGSIAKIKAQRMLHELKQLIETGEVLR